MKWDANLPASYWLLAARLFANDAIEFYWIHTTVAGDVRLGLNCNDHFVPGSDAEWVDPEDAAELLALLEAAQPPNSGMEGYKAACQAALDWVARRRGYTDGRSWKEKIRVPQPEYHGSQVFKAVNEHATAAPVKTLSKAAEHKEPISNPDSHKGKFLCSRHKLVAELAKWALLQSPHRWPRGLEDACNQLFHLLPDGKDDLGFFWQSGPELEARLWEAIAKIPEVMAWNVPRSGHGAQVMFVSVYDGPRNPDDDFIDLHALVRNIRLSVQREHAANHPARS